MNRSLTFWTSILLGAEFLAVPGAWAAKVPPPPDAARQKADFYRMYLEAQELAGEGKTREARHQLERILAAEPQAVPVRVALAKVCLRDGDSQCAIQEAQRALEIDPQDGESHKIMADIALTRYQSMSLRDPRDLDAALSHYEKAAANRPQDLSVWLAWVRLLGIEGRFDEAENVAQRAASIPGLDPGAPWMALARIMMSRGENDRLASLLSRVEITGQSAIPLLETLAEIKGTRGDFEGQAQVLERLRGLRPEDLETARRLGAARIELADPWGALQPLQEAFASQPADPLIRRDLARALVRLGRGREALDFLAGIPEVFRSRQTLLTWAQASEQAGRWAEAADRFSEVAAALNPQEKADLGPGLRLREAQAWLKAGQPAKALDLVDPLPPVPQVTRFRLEILDALEKPDLSEKILQDIQGSAIPEGLALRLDRQARREGETVAVEQARRAINGLPEKTETAGRASGLLLAWDRPQVAFALLETLPVVPDASFAFLRTKAAVHQALGQREQAEKIYRDLLAGEPDDPGLLNDLGFLLADNPSLVPEALSLLEKALALKPEVGAYVDSYGYALLKAGRPSEAVVQLRKAVRLSSDRDEPEIREHLGDAYLALGDQERALAEWKAALVLAENRREVLKKKIAGLETVPSGP